MRRDTRAARAARSAILAAILAACSGVAFAEEPPPPAPVPPAEAPAPAPPPTEPPPPAPPPGATAAPSAATVPVSPTARKGYPAPDVRPRPPEPPPPGVAVPGWDLGHESGDLPLPPPLPPKDPFDARPIRYRHDRLVSADGRLKEVRRVPQWVDVMERSEIEEYRPQELGELLRRFPNVMVGDGGSPFLALPNIRGLGGDRVRIMTDGVWPETQALGVGGGTLSLWDPESVERVEVYHGPGAYLRGADSTGGFINIVPQRPHRHPCFGVWGSFASGWNSADQRFRERIELDAGMGRVAALMGLTYDDWGDRDTADGTLDPSTWHRFSADVAADYFLDNQSTVGITGQWVRAEDVESPLGDAFEHPQYERQFLALTLSSFAAGPIFHGTRLSIAIDSYFLEDEAEASTSPTAGLGSEDDSDTFAFSLQGNLYIIPCHETWGELAVAYTHLERTERILCADRVIEEGEFTEFLRRQMGRSVDPQAVPGECVEAETSFEATEFRIKGLLEDQWHSACWDFHAGVRGDFIYLEDDRTGEEETDFTFAVAFGVARHLSSDVTVFGNASYGQRHPSVAERLEITILDGKTVFPNEDLENEISVNAEAGVKVAHGNRSTIQAAGFVHWLGDYVGRRDVGVDQVWDNLGDAFLYGAEVTGAWRPDPCRCEGFELFGSVGITLSSDEDVVDDVPFHGRAGARYSNCYLGPCGVRRWFVEAAARGALDSDSQDGTGGDAFVTAEVFTGLGFALGARRAAFLTAGVTNLLDEDYTEVRARLPAQGRSLQVSVQLDL
jgi:outer membrane receptor protein involved in Fe transport